LNLLDKSREGAEMQFPNAGIKYIYIRLLSQKVWN
jgi:hypothetical protein